jgi:hypothetical protein
MRFQVLTAASIKMTVFWDVVLCSLDYRLQPTRRNIPEDRYRHQLFFVLLFLISSSKETLFSFHVFFVLPLKY